MKTHQRNLITDVDGISVGHAHDEKLASGVTVVLAERRRQDSGHDFRGRAGNA